MDSPTWGTPRHIIFCQGMQSRGAEKSSIREQHKPATLVLIRHPYIFFFRDTTLYTTNKRASCSILL
jgi:hypothetical protein